MSNVKRDDVVAALRAEDVASHLGIQGAWRGRWMRSPRCAESDHASDAFALARDGHWHCWSCDKGGDLLMLLALGENLSIKDDFPKVLEIAAGIAGVEVDPGADMFGIGPTKPPPRPRAELPTQLPMEKRIPMAKQAAAWAWERLHEDPGIPGSYLKARGLDPALVLVRESVRSTPIRLGAELRARIERGDPTVSAGLRTLWWTMGVKRGTLSIVVPVRSVKDGAMVDLRARRLEPLEGQPKIIGMVGGVTSAPAERGKMRQLVGCYGRPHEIDADHVVVVEGALDYLTGLQVWPNAQILGAVEAGTLALVTAHVAAALAALDSTSRLTIVEQADPPRTLKDGRVVAGAADQSINEDPNAAAKVAVRLLGPGRVGWIYCSYAGDDGAIGSPCAKLDGEAAKDLNDLLIVGADIPAMLTRWIDLER